MADPSLRIASTPVSRFIFTKYVHSPPQIFRLVLLRHYDFCLSLKSLLVFSLKD